MGCMTNNKEIIEFCKQFLASSDTPESSIEQVLAITTALNFDKEKIKKNIKLIYEFIGSRILFLAPVMCARQLIISSDFSEYNELNDYESIQAIDLLIGLGLASNIMSEANQYSDYFLKNHELIYNKFLQLDFQNMSLSDYKNNTVLIYTILSYHYYNINPEFLKEYETELENFNDEDIIKLLDYWFLNNYENSYYLKFYDEFVKLLNESPKYMLISVYSSVKFSKSVDDFIIMTHLESDLDTYIKNMEEIYQSANPNNYLFKYAYGFLSTVKKQCDEVKSPPSL